MSKKATSLSAPGSNSARSSSNSPLSVRQRIGIARFQCERLCNKNFRAQAAKQNAATMGLMWFGM